MLSVGNRFTDWSASSWRRGVTFSIPPTRLIQLDIDPREIGKNYPVEVALVGDARAALDDLLAALGPAAAPPTTATRRTFEEIQPAQGEPGSSAPKRRPAPTRTPMTMARAVREVQRGDADDAIVVTGAGLPQGMVKQRWVTRRPRTHITSGGFSTMGFTLPAAIGAQLARPEREVLAVCGDGDFLQTMQELQTAVLAGTPVCTVVLDNSGWISIKGGQETLLRPLRVDRLPHARRLALLAGLRGHRRGVRDPLRARRRPDGGRSRGRAGRLPRAGRRSSTSRSSATSPSPAPRRPGWWDAPSPAYDAERHARWQGRRRRGAAPMTDGTARGRRTEPARHARRPGDALADAPIGTVPILWNNVDVDELRLGTDAATILDEIARVGYEGTPARTRLPEGRRAAIACSPRRGLRLAEVYAALPATVDGPG